MEEKQIIESIQPKPYEVVGVKFDIFGKVPKSWLLYGKYGPGMDWMDIKGNNLPTSGPLADIVPSLFSKFRKNVRFRSRVDLGCFQASEHPRGLIIEVSSHNNQDFVLLPLIIGGTNKIYNVEHGELKEKLLSGVNRIINLKKDYENYKKELHKIYKGIVHNKEILEGVFDILEKSEVKFEEFSDSEEDDQEKKLVEKYRDAIAWKGPMLSGVAGRMAGFEFRVYSGDHDPKHFHVIHKSRGVDARFSYPQIELINYKGRMNNIGGKESDKIRQFFRITQNLKKLDAEFQKQITIK